MVLHYIFVHAACFITYSSYLLLINVSIHNLTPVKFLTARPKCSFQLNLILPLFSLNVKIISLYHLCRKCIQKLLRQNGTLIFKIIEMYDFGHVHDIVENKYGNNCLQKLQRRKTCQVENCSYYAELVPYSLRSSQIFNMMNFYISCLQTEEKLKIGI